MVILNNITFLFLTLFSEPQRYEDRSSLLTEAEPPAQNNNRGVSHTLRHTENISQRESVEMSHVVHVGRLFTHLNPVLDCVVKLTPVFFLVYIL